MSTRIDSNSVTLDTTAPSLASATVTNVSPTNTLIYSLTYGSVLSGTYASYCILENSTTVASCAWVAGTVPTSYTVSSTQDAKVLSIWLRDDALNVSARVDTNSVTLSTTAPVVASVTITNTSPTNTNNYGLTYGTVTGAYVSYCILENTTTVGSCTFTSGTLPSNFAVSATENAKVLSVWVKDSAGNVSNRTDSNSVTLDTTAPILASAAISNTDPTNTTTYSLTFGSVTETYASYCILENSTTVSGCTYTSGTLPASFTVSTTQNAKVLSVWLKDAAGNVSSRVDTGSVTLDSGTVSLASAVITNSSPTNSTTFALNYGTASPYNRYCILENDTSLSNCTFTTGTLPSSFTVSSTENGKVLSLWIRNAAGTTSGRVDTNSVTLDTTAPTAPTLSLYTPSSSPGNNTTPVFRASSAALGTTLTLHTASNCSAGSQVASVSVSSTTQNITSSALTEGSYSVYAKETDSAGNVSTCTTPAVAYNLDTTTPSLASASVTNTTPTNTTTYSLTYGAVSSGPYTKYCVLENDTTLSNCTFTAGTLPTFFTVSNSNGAKVLSVWIRDDAGNTSARVDTNSVTLDNTTPVLASITISNTSPTNTTTYSLSYGAVTGSYSDYCLLENSTTIGSCSWTTGTLPTTKTVGGTENAKVISAWIRTAAGNVSNRVDSNSVSLDTTSPVLASASITNSSPTNSTSYALTYGSVTGTYASYCILENNTSVSSCSYTSGTLPSSFSVSGTNNAKTLSVWLKDAAGNVSTRVDTGSVTLDTSVPTLASVTITNSTPTNTVVYSLTYGTQSGAYAAYCLLENSTTIASCSWTSGTLPSSYTVSNTNNAKVLSVWIKNSAGSTSIRADSNSVTLDTVIPSLASASISNTSPTKTTTYALTYGTVTDTYASYCILENNTTLGSCTFTAGTLPASFTVSATENAKVLSIWIKDAAGNVSTRVDTGSVTLDITAPILASVTITNSSPTNSLVYSLTYGAVTGSYLDYCILENSTVVGSCSWTTGTLPPSFTVSSSENAKVLSIWIRDAAGNVSTKVDTNSVTLDTTAPVIASATISNANPSRTTAYSLSYGSQTGSFASYCILENNTSVSSCAYISALLPSSYTVTSTANAKVLSLWLKDAAGNVSTRVDTNSVTYSPPAAFAFHWPFTNGTDSNYTFSDITKIFISGNTTALVPTDQIDDDNTSSGFGGGTSVGVVWDSSNSVLRLGNGGGCDGSSTGCLVNISPTLFELNSSWTPHYSDLVWYAKLDGSGSISTGTGNIPATVGANGDAVNATGTGMEYVPGKINQAVKLTETEIQVPAATAPNLGSTMTAMFWLNASNASQLNDWVSFFGKLTNGTGFMVQRLGNTSGFQLRIDTSGGTNQTRPIYMDILNGQFHHIAFSLDNGSTRIYIDGALVDSGSYSVGGGFAAPTINLTMGGGIVGTLDEVGVFQSVLSDADIFTIYQHQAVNHSGYFTSRVMDAKAAALTWSKLSWTPSLPFSKELPDAISNVAQNETSTSYPGLVGNTGALGENNLMNQLVGLWHLNETTTGTAPGGKDFTDTSGQGNHGTLVGDTTPGVAGFFRVAAKMGGSTSQIDVGTGIDLSYKDFTISVWARRDSTGSNQILIGQGAPGTDSALHIGFRSNNEFTFAFYGDDMNHNSSATTDGKWHQWTMSFNAATKTRNLYIDGQLVRSEGSYGVYVGTGTLLLGNSDWWNAHLNGAMDEVAIWTRTLHDKEVLQLYRRGANQMRHQVRVCTTSDCSDDSLGVNWKGPDGSFYSTFSELQNNSVPASNSGIVKASGPVVNFTDFTNPVGTSRYFQYRTIFETIDSGTGCNYGSGAVACSPELKAVSVDPKHYDKTSPTVIGKTGSSYLTLSTFTETLGTSCAEGVGYNIGIGASSAAAIWYWWDVSANAGSGGWVTSDGTASKSNAASVVQSHAAAFSTTLGAGTVYLKAFLKSDGNTPCALDDIEVDGTQ